MESLWTWNLSGPLIFTAILICSILEARPPPLRLIRGMTFQFTSIRNRRCLVWPQYIDLTQIHRANISWYMNALSQFVKYVYIHPIVRGINWEERRLSNWLYISSKANKSSTFIVTAMFHVPCNDIMTSWPHKIPIRVFRRKKEEIRIERRKKNIVKSNPMTFLFLPNQLLAYWIRLGILLNLLRWQR